jgi:hypothetical protein
VARAFWLAFLDSGRDVLGASTEIITTRGAFVLLNRFASFNTLRFGASRAMVVSSGVEAGGI